MKRASLLESGINNISLVEMIQMQFVEGQIQVVPDVPTGYLLVDDMDEAYRRLNGWLKDNQTPSKL